MGAAADSVFLLQKVYFFLGGVISCEIPIDAAFAALHITATVQCGVNLVLGDEHSQLRYFRHVGGIFPTREAVVLQHMQHTLGIVQAEAHQAVILFISERKRSQLGCQRLTESRVFQFIGKPCCCVGETTFPMVCQCGHIPLRSCFIADIPIVIPKSFCKLRSFMALCLNHFHI